MTLSFRCTAPGYTLPKNDINLEHKNRAFLEQAYIVFQPLFVGCSVSFCEGYCIWVPQLTLCFFGTQIRFPTCVSLNFHIHYCHSDFDVPRDHRNDTHVKSQCVFCCVDFQEYCIMITSITYDNILLMEEILQHLIGSSSYLQGVLDPRWLFGISSINSINIFYITNFSVEVF